MSGSPAPAPGDNPLKHWVDRLEERDLPVLGGTMRDICSATDDGGSSATDLARVVLRDVGLTSDIIRAANSVYFNASGRRIATVSRAVVVLGFDTVRSIGLSLALLDSLVRGHDRARVHRLFAESVEAALCARAMAEAHGERGPEELFIGALLGRVGELAFWCMADSDVAERLEATLSRGDLGQRECERECLGFSLRELSRALAREWRLGELVEDSLRAGGPLTGRARTANTAHQAIERLAGGDEPGAVQTLREGGVADADTAHRIIERVRLEAPAIARALGVELEAVTPAIDQGTTAEEEPPRVPDPALQLRILREMLTSVSEQGDLQTLFDLLMEGLYRGVAVQRCAVATVRRGGQGLRVRASLGDGGGLGDALAEATEDAVTRVLLRDTTGMLANTDRRALPDTLRAALLPCVLVGPLRANGRTLGVILAELDAAATPEISEGFEHFVQHSELCVGTLIRNGR